MSGRLGLGFGLLRGLLGGGLGLAMAAWLAVASISEWADRVKLTRSGNMHEIWARISNLPRSAHGMTLAHFGMAVLIAGVASAMFDAGGYPNLAARPYLKQAINAFGAERIMWASDISANQTGESWAELIFAIRENPELSESEKQSILAGTAREWLNWK
mgnify:CR=1 FL=1